MVSAQDTAVFSPQTASGSSCPYTAPRRLVCSCSTPSFFRIMTLPIPPVAPSQFADSIAYSLRQTFVYTGRASSREFWWFTLGQVLLEVVMTFVQGSLIVMGSSSVLVALVFVVARVGAFLAWLSLLVRRAHDLGKGAWWLLFGPLSLSLLPLLVLPVLLIGGAAGGAPDFIKNPSTGSLGLLVLGLVFFVLVFPTVVYFVVLGRRGQLGENLYGPRPTDQLPA